MCNFCSVGCELDLNVVSDGLLWASAPETFIPGRGELCLKGRFGTGLIEGPERLRKPLVKKEGRLVEVGWDEAIQAAARVLKEQAPNAVAVLAAPRMTLEEAMLLRHVAAALGTSKVGSYGQNRRGGTRNDLDDVLGETASTCTQDDIGTADLILLAGADPGSNHPVLGMAIRRAAKKGAEIVSVNSSPVDLVRPTDLWIDARRGTAGILFASVLNCILQQGLADGRNTASDGLDALKSSVSSATLAMAAATAGVDPGKIEACAHKVAAAGKVVAVYDLDDTLEKATDDLKALAQLLIVTGHIGKKGEGLLLLRSDCNGEGARIAGIADSLHLEQVSGALVMFENPLGDYRAARELEQIRSLVVIDHFLTATGRTADVVLPATTFAETDGTVVSFDGRLSCITKATSPIPGLTTAEVLARLSQALGRPVRSLAPADIRADLASAAGIAAADLEQARSAKQQWPKKPAAAVGLKAVRLDPTSSVANVFPYASLDGMLERKLEEFGVPRP